VVVGASCSYPLEQPSVDAFKSVRNNPATRDAQSKYCRNAQAGSGRHNDKMTI